MGHQNGGHAGAPLHRANGFAQLSSNIRIQGAERFVEQQHLGFVRQSSGNGDALLLAPGQLAGITRVEPLERDQLEQFLAPPPAVGGAHAAHSQREFDVIGNRHVPEQCVVLKDHPDAALARRQFRDIPPVKRHPPVIDVHEAGKRTQQRALAAARGP